ncbi:hypothetical protein C8B47_09920 [filamentous cyanobacterium CCP4]|nr:hypothetical protein C8B47_09920 [filamentous cyanobacterium CCP4]
MHRLPKESLQHRGLRFLKFYSQSDVAPNDEMNKIEAVLSSFGVKLQTLRTKNIQTLALADDLKKAHLEQGSYTP